MSAIAISNNNVACIAWKQNRIDSCLGYALYRINADSGKIEPLQSKIGFKDQPNVQWKSLSTEQRPIQSFHWFDFDATPGGAYQYKIIPMVGNENDLKPHTDSSLTLITNKVQITPECGDGLLSFFNRGLLSTQSVHYNAPLDSSGKPDSAVIASKLKDPNDALRKHLTGGIVQGLRLLLDKAKQEGGQCYCSLYELNDQELTKIIMNNSKLVHLIFYKYPPKKDKNTGEIIPDTEDENLRVQLQNELAEFHTRGLKSDHLAHNKFVVYVDKNNTPQAVLTGSTNWTYTGLCGSTNNALIINSSQAASFYYDYWNRIKTDTQNDNQQGPDFRIANCQPRKTSSGNMQVSVWFSPNTKLSNKPSQDPSTPIDMEDVFSAMDSANNAIIFLAFIPGKPSVITKAAECKKKKPELFIYGAVTDTQRAIGDYDTYLHYDSPEPTEFVKSDSVVTDDGSVVAATKINDDFSFWHKELLKLDNAFAVIHDKIIVIDPFSENCVVITGSHNLGFKASYGNDDNLVMIRGNKSLAASYTAHVMDLCGHFHWRAMVQNDKDKAWSSLETDDTWQDKFFVNGSPEQREIEFWTGK